MTPLCCCQSATSSSSTFMPPCPPYRRAPPTAAGVTDDNDTVARPPKKRKTKMMATAAGPFASCVQIDDDEGLDEELELYDFKVYLKGRRGPIPCCGHCVECCDPLIASSSSFAEPVSIEYTERFVHHALPNIRRTRVSILGKPTAILTRYRSDVEDAPSATLAKRYPRKRLRLQVPERCTNVPTVENEPILILGTRRRAMPRRVSGANASADRAGAQGHAEAQPPPRVASMRASPDSVLPRATTPPPLKGGAKAAWLRRHSSMEWLNLPTMTACLMR